MSFLEEILIHWLPKQTALGLLIMLISTCTLHTNYVIATPIRWIEIPSTADGLQWLDEDSLRETQDGKIQVLSRFSPNNENEQKSNILTHKS